MEATIEARLAVDPATLSAGQAVDHLVWLDQLISRASARRERTLAALGDPTDEKNFVVEDVRCALRWSDTYTAAMFAHANKLVRELPDALAAHETGELNCAQARALTEGCAQLDTAACAEVSEKVLPRAGSQTVTQFKQKLTRTVHAVDPRTAECKHAEDKRQRDVSMRVLPNGMAGIWSTHTALDAEAIMTRVISWTSPTGRIYIKRPDDLPGWEWQPHDEDDLDPP